MVCKEEVVSWFKESVSYKRLDLMCTLLNMCLPFELRFLGTCLEELGKRDFTELRDAEKCANSPGDVGEAQCVSDQHTRRKLALYLALLHSANHGCSHVIYKTLANFDFAEIQTLLGNASLLSVEDDNPLDELLLLYTMALNHPAFTYEQKSVFGSIFMKLQDEEAKIAPTQNKSPSTTVSMKPNVPVSRPMQQPQPSHSHSHFVVCQPMYMPCTASTESPQGAVGQQYASTMKPIILPANLSSAGKMPCCSYLKGDAGKAMPIQEIPPGPYFPVFPNAGGPQSSSSVLFCMPPPHGMAQAVAAPSTPSASEYPCPQPSFMVPSMGGELACQAGLPPVAVNNSLPSATNAEFTSPYRSPCNSPYGSPEASRSGSPGWCSSSTQPGNSGYKGGAQVPPRHGSSSSSSSCSGGSTGGYRSRRNKQPHNGQMTTEEVPPQPTVEQMRPTNVDDHLRGMIANMTLANGLCSNVEPRQRIREDKRRWMNPAAPAPTTQNSGSAGSSHSDSSSPPASPPQEEAWDTNKEEASKWEKMQGGLPVQLPPARASGMAQCPPRGAMGHTVVRRSQEVKHGNPANRRPVPAIPYALYTTGAQGMQPIRASTGAIFQTGPAYLGGTTIFSPTAMLPPPTSGPASFPSFTPNGITSPPPELLYNVPPSSQTSPPPPFPVQQFVPPKQTSSPPPSFMTYAAPSYPPPPVTANAKPTCYNCGGSNHRGPDCREPSIEEVMRRGQYRLDFNTPQSSIEVSLPSQHHPQQQVSGSSSNTAQSGGGNTGTNTSSEK